MTVIKNHFEVSVPLNYEDKIMSLATNWPRLRLCCVLN
jgi:hypothetical protein